ncbi:MAG: hypothetical protein WED15_03515 [Akkermansiaceae bacterium]
MFQKIPFLVLACLLASPCPLRAQNELDPNDAGDTSGPQRFWQAHVGGGHFMVALSRIVSISRHQYVLDGTLIVDEVTVDSSGQALARFYHISPISDATAGNSAAGIINRGRELVDKAAQRAGTDVQNMVIKKYPETTHARTIEYRVSSAQELTSLYSSVRSAWESGRGRQFTAAKK